MTYKISDLPYRSNVGIMLINKYGKAFAAKRMDNLSDAWQMPQGGIDDGEEPKEAALREMLEEIGTDKAEIIAESQKWISYDLPNDLIPKVWDGKFRGQKQKWFLLKFTGEDSDINIDTKEPEFTEWKWVEPQTLPEIIVPFKKQTYQDVIKEFEPYL